MLLNLGAGSRSWEAAILFIACGLAACAVPSSGGFAGRTGGGAGVESGGGVAANGGGAAATGAGIGGDPHGAAGAGGAPPIGASVTFDPPSRTFQGEIDVTLTASDPAVEIRYATDGRLPDPSSPIYRGTPLRLTATTEVRAQTYLKGVAVGPSTAGLYVARALDVAVDLPIALVDTWGRGSLRAENRAFVNAAFMIFGAETGIATMAALPSLASRAGVHVRGQSSSTFPKLPFRIELRDAHDNDLDQPLLGMPADSDWVLHGPYPDKTLIRNAFVYQLGRELGRASPRFAFVELYVNTAARPVSAADYLGVYLLVETIKNQKHRLNLQQLTPQDVTLPALAGGYIFKFDLGAAVDPILPCNGVTASCWEDLELYDPVPAAPDQRTYVTSTIQAFHDALHSDSFADPAAGYAAHIDVPSFVDQLIIHELTRNMDAYVRSQYFHKDRDGKIVAGPVWDYDLTMNVGGMFENRDIEGWQHVASASRGCNDWFQRLWTDPAFVAAVGARWKELRQGPLSDAAVEARVAALTAGLANAAARNFQRWPILTVTRVSFFNTPTESTWEGQLENMKTWLRNRSAWLDAQFP